MRGRDSNVPLVVSLVIVLAGHAALVPGFSALLEPAGRSGSAMDAPPTAEQRELDIGRSQRGPSQVSWIAYDDYRELMAATASDVRQPALQSEVEPVPEAPLELDPTPPAPSAAAAPAPTARELPEPAEAAEAMEAPDLLAEAPEAALPPTEAETPFRAPSERVAVGMPEDADADKHEHEQEQPPRQAEASPEAPELTEAQAAAADEQVRPTAAAHSEREAALADLTARTHRVQPGAVIAVGDFEIETRRPRFSAVARSSAVPRNPVAELTFDPDGSVGEVRFLRDTGYSNVDRPLRTSLYRWRATGEGLEAIDEPFTMTVEITLVRGSR